MIHLKLVTTAIRVKTDEAVLFDRRLHLFSMDVVAVVACDLPMLNAFFISFVLGM